MRSAHPLFLLCLLCLALPGAASAGEPFPSIALFEWQGESRTEHGFRDGILKEHPDARFYVYNAAGDAALLDLLLQVAETRRHDLYYVSGTAAAKSLLQKVPEKPIVFTMVQDPVKEALVASLESSENNATGISNAVPVLKQLKTLKRIVPFSSLGVFFDPEDPDSLQQVEELVRLQPFLSYELRKLPIRTEEEARRSDLSALDAVYLPYSPLLDSLADPILQRVNSARIPSLAADMKMITGHRALLGLVPDNYRIGRLAARSALDILQGTPPTAVPSRSLDFFMVALNMQTAEELKVQVPFSLLVIADTIVR